MSTSIPDPRLAFWHTVIAAVPEIIACGSHVESRGGVCGGCDLPTSRTFAYGAGPKGAHTFYLCLPCYKERVHRAINPPMLDNGR